MLFNGIKITKQWALEMDLSCKTHPYLQYAAFEVNTT